MGEFMIISARKKLPSISLDKEYVVLELGASRNGDIYYRIERDDRTPVLVKPEDFEVTSNKLPVSWIAQWLEVGSVIFCPLPWTRKDFWERFFDREPEAERIFKEERDKIISQS